jgi:hypothetical protein
MANTVILTFGETTMQIYTPELSARILSLMSDVALSNNGWAITTDIEAAEALKLAGYTLSPKPLGFVGSVGVYSPQGQQAATAEFHANYVVPVRTLESSCPFDAENALLARAERMTMDY